MRSLGLVLLTAILGTTSAGAESLGDVDNGEKQFNKFCSSCHMVGESARNRVGPVLNGIFGRTAGKVEGFKYSKAFQRAGAKGLEWHADEMGVFIENPKQLVPGTRMSFRGIKNPTDRADLVAFLRQFSDSPSDIPEADPTALPTDHSVAPEILALEGDPEYGEYLSSECTTCHRADGADEGIPSIVLWPELDFVVAMHAYKDNAREHPVMNMVAGRLSDEEIAALAAYFATLED
ncbi:MAG: c-type cytochrome [Boseongicola sp.]|nr:c-type cytochrome [Boseongicola sp.]